MKVVKIANKISLDTKTVPLIQLSVIWQETAKIIRVLTKILAKIIRQINAIFAIPDILIGMVFANQIPINATINPVLVPIFKATRKTEIVASKLKKCFSRRNKF